MFIGTWHNRLAVGVAKDPSCIKMLLQERVRQGRRGRNLRNEKECDRLKERYVKRLRKVAGRDAYRRFVTEVSATQGKLS